MKCVVCGAPSEAPYCRKCFDNKIRELFPDIKEGWTLIKNPDGSYTPKEVWIGIKLKKEAE